MPVEYMITLKPIENDDPHFVAILERVFQNTVQLHHPSDVYVVRIDNWFDYKWLEFSGTVMHEIAVWKYKLTLPPFHPSRVTSQLYFHASNTMLYEVGASEPLHIIQPSDRNLRRTLAQVSSLGMFAWYSATNDNSDRGSLMVYAVGQENASAWYASFRKDQEWCVDKLKGISKREFSRLLEVTSATHDI